MSQPESIDVHVDPTRSEVYRASLLVLLGRYDAKRAILFALSLVFLGAMIWKLLSTSENELVAEYSAIIGLGLFPFGLIGLTATAWYFGIRRELRRNPKIVNPTDYSFMDQKVEMSNSFGRSEVFWTVFERIQEAKWVFLLHISYNRAYLIPKRCFSRAEDVVQFRELLRRAYPGKVSLRSE